MLPSFVEVLKLTSPGLATTARLCLSTLFPAGVFTTRTTVGEKYCTSTSTPFTVVRMPWSVFWYSWADRSATQNSPPKINIDLFLIVFIT